VAELVSTLLQRAPSLRMLITSRQLLQLPEEVVLRLDGLEVPREGTPLEVAGTQGAVALLVKGARMAEPRFEILDRKQINVVRDMLLHWCNCVMRSKEEPMKDVAALVCRHLEGIVAWLRRARPTASPKRSTACTRPPSAAHAASRACPPSGPSSS